MWSIPFWNYEVQLGLDYFFKKLEFNYFFAKNIYLSFFINRDQISNKKCLNKALKKLDFYKKVPIYIYFFFKSLMRYLWLRFDCLIEKFKIFLAKIIKCPLNTFLLKVIKFESKYNFLVFQKQIRIQLGLKYISKKHFVNKVELNSNSKKELYYDWTLIPNTKSNLQLVRIKITKNSL